MNISTLHSRYCVMKTFLNIFNVGQSCSDGYNYTEHTYITAMTTLHVHINFRILWLSTRQCIRAT